MIFISHLNSPNTSLTHPLIFSFFTGDFAYDLRDNGGLNGDAFMARIERLASRVPYMTSVGNHEIDADTFQNYRLCMERR